MAERIGPASPIGMRKVHVGCGPHAVMEDWWNIDIRKFPGIDEAFDATQAWHYTDLHYVYAEHFLEHLALDRAIQFLIQAGNSLREGGVIRLSTPNLEWVVHTHFQTGQTEEGKRLMDTLRMNRAFHGWGHQFLYSQEMLVHILSAIGYTAILPCTYGQSNHQELNSLEKHGGFSVAGGFPSVVILEATRGFALLRYPRDLSAYLEENFLRYVASGH
jgi:predicted SAM-dependent methyltransferase